MLTSEKGGKITCTDGNGCTKVWPDTELPKGTTAATAGRGVQASLLGTAKGADGDLYVTYHGWPLYTYAGDSGPAEAHGEGLTSFGGTWYVLNAAGTPVTSAHTQSSGSSPGGSGNGGSMPNSNGGGSYGY
jgi:predicted lipoprotein with Yx(FWY)xxD motif